MGMTEMQHIPVKSVDLVIKMMRKQYMRKPCKKCGEIFRPTGKYCMVCDTCLEKSLLKKQQKGGKENGR